MAALIQRPAPAFKAATVVDGLFEDVFFDGLPLSMVQVIQSHSWRDNQLLLGLSYSSTLCTRINTIWHLHLEPDDNQGNSLLSALPKSWPSMMP